MTYSTNLRGYSTPWSLQPYRLWCFILLWHLTTFYGSETWLDCVVCCTSVRLPGKINGLLTAVQSGCFCISDSSGFHIIRICQSERLVIYTALNFIRSSVQLLYYSTLSDHTLPQTCRLVFELVTPCLFQGRQTGSVRDLVTPVTGDRVLSSHVQCQLPCVMPQLSCRWVSARHFSPRCCAVLRLVAQKHGNSFPYPSPRNCN